MNIQELSDMEILQMQWSILEEVKQQRAKRESHPVNIDFVHSINKIPSEGILSKLQKTFKGETKTKTPSKRSRTIHPPVILPNGVKLASSHCIIYAEVIYAGDGKIKLGNRQTLQLSVTQLLDLMRNFDSIPKKGMDARIRWAEKRYGVHMCAFDRIIWNLYQGTFTKIFEEYYNKNYQINFDENGDLQIGE